MSKVRVLSDLLDASNDLEVSYLPNSGVTAGSYGTTVQVPVLTIDASGRITAASTAAITHVEAVTSLSINANVLTYTDENGANTTINLSNYLDDTNLARLVSGTLNGSTGVATFTRDDNSTFTVNFSALLDDTTVTVNDTLTSTSTTQALSANQGKVLNDTKLNLSAAYVHPTTAGNKHIPTGGSTGEFLKYSASGTAVWSADNDTIYVHPTTAGNKHIPTGGAANQYLKYSASGVAVWADIAADTNTTYTHAISIQTGGAGIDLVPSSGSTDTVKVTGSGATTISRVDADTINITSTDTDNSIAMSIALGG